MKILFVVTTLNSGGIENYLLRFLTGHSNLFEATVLCKGGVYGELEERYRALHNISLVKFNVKYSSIIGNSRLKEFLLNGNFDTVCDFTGNFAGVILREAQRAGIKNRIAFYRGSRNRFKETFLKRQYNNYVKKLVLKHATSILSNSQAAFDYFFKYPDNRFEVIYNGLNIDDFVVTEERDVIRKMLKIPKDVYVVGHTGRLHYSKNQETIISVAHIVCEKNKNIHFVLCGKNTEKLENRIKSELKDRIHLLGYRDDVPRILKAMNLYFFPSVTEGQPNALIEAMFMGLPIVASNIEPIKETTPPDIHHRLYNPNDVYGFAKEIESVYIHNEEMPKLKEWALKKYDAKVQFRKFYNKLTI